VLAVDALGQLMGPHGYPIWPLMALLVAALAVAEGLPLALGIAGRRRCSRSPRRCARCSRRCRPTGAPAFDARPVAAAAFGYFALALAVNRALAGEKRRLVRDARRAGAAQARHRPAERRARRGERARARAPPRRCAR
jgi:hypothetical protein